MRRHGAKDPREALLRQAREMFTQQLGDLYSWHNVAVGPPEEWPESTGMSEKAAAEYAEKRRELGKYQQKVRLQFDQFEIVVNSPEQQPPLGGIVLSIAMTTGLGYAGLDHETWKRVAGAIREHKQELEHAGW